MKRTLVVLAILAAPHLTAARGRSCHEVSSIVGFQRCSRFGNGWSRSVPMWWEFGVAALRYDPKPIDATATTVHDGQMTTYHVVAAPGDDRAITAVGARFRSAIGFGRSFYLATEVTFAPVTGGPRLVADVAARGTTMTMDTTTGGWVSEDMTAIGYHASVGPVTLATELAPGVRVASYTTTQLPDLVHPPTQGSFLFELHEKADLWLNPNVSLGVQASVDIVHRDNLTVAMTLGLHVMPFDRTR